MASADTFNELVYFNGVNGASGEYGLKPRTEEQLIQDFITGEPQEPENLSELKLKTSFKDFPVTEGDPADLAQVGWGIVFPHKVHPGIREALQPLIDLRRAQVNNDQIFRIYEGEDGFLPDDSKRTFTQRHGVGPGSADPKEMPYYMLIVGSPDEISYRFQYQLDVQRAVGRIYFNDLNDYAAYAQSVVTAETQTVKLPRRMAFFGVANPDDKATQLSSQYLIRPLADKLRLSDDLDWDISVMMGAQAQKASLSHLLGGEQTPALLFTASHGMEFPNGDLRQIPHQGAILCQDWPGPRGWQGPISQDFYFAGDDLTSDQNLLGLISFHFACFGAGTPRYDEFTKIAGRRQRRAIAPRNFNAQLPTKMLAHPKGGALAVIGHVERAWGYSFIWPGVGSQTGVFEAAIKQILRGDPVGFATEHLNLRYAELATSLTQEIENREFDEKGMTDKELVGEWTAHNDARGYVILGDPAVRVRVADSADETLTERPVIELTPIAGPTAIEEPAAPETPQPVTSFAGSGGQNVTPLDATSAELAAANYGLGSDIMDSIQKLSREVSAKLSEAVADLSSLDVRTYTASGDLRGEEVSYDKSKKDFGQGANLRARTHISLDGDLFSLVPERPVDPFDDEAGVSSEIDQELWAIHQQMVELAQSNRIALVQAMGEVVSSLVRSVTGR